MKQITIATYNIRHGYDVGFRWERLATHIRACDADLVGIQEVDMGTARSLGLNTVAGLSRAAGLPHTLFIPAMDFDGGQYGTAILSRFPITEKLVLPLEAGDYEPRAFGCVTVTLPDGSPFRFLNTHLSYESAAQQKLQLVQLAAWMERNIPAESPCVLTGDFNTEDFASFAPLKVIGYALVNDDGHRYPTFRTEPIAIDNIVYRTACLFPTDTGMIVSDTSDHNLLLCRFTLAS